METIKKIRSSMRNSKFVLSSEEEIENFEKEKVKLEDKFTFCIN